MLRSSCKPPLARSPIRLRSRRVLQPTSNTMKTPPGSLMKTQKPIRAGEVETGLGLDFATISCDLRALTKMVQQEFGREEMDCDVADFGGDVCNVNRSPLFERGRFYEEYERRRNERLRKKKGEKGCVGMEDKKPVYDLGVRTEVVKRRGDAKKFESARKRVVPATPVTQRKEPTTTSRYLLRSSTSKENKKPLLASSSSFSSVIGEKTGARRGRRI
ncbi:hypothetical protein Leryth_002840 [Lithospermum erythrorhizon]|nr:hypothetical protein Leryth_002840 [Lithospermum erythrorhizon]